MSQVLYGIAFTAHGGPPPHDEVVEWHGMLFLDRSEALEALESLGWTGYVAEYPTGERPWLKRT